jgi:hypothetical protein
MSSEVPRTSAFNRTTPILYPRFPILPAWGKGFSESFALGIDATVIIPRHATFLNNVVKERFGLTNRAFQGYHLQKAVAVVLAPYIPLPSVPTV